MRVLLVAALFSAGCLGDRGVDSNPLGGTKWSAPVTGLECSIVGEFADDINYAYGLGCTLNSGQPALQLEGGTYVVDGDKLTTTARESSCPAADVTVTQASTFTFTGRTLTVVNSTGVIVFDRVYPGGPTSGAVALGCFDSQGVFTERPLLSL